MSEDQEAIKYGIVGSDTEMGLALTMYLAQSFGRLSAAKWGDLERIKGVLDECDVVFFAPQATENYRALIEDDLRGYYPIGLRVWVNFASGDSPALNDFSVIADQISVRFDSAKGENPFEGVTVLLSMCDRIVCDAFIGSFADFLAGAVKPGGRLSFQASQSRRTSAVCLG